MTYIKKMVIQGFKSFAKRTEVIFDQQINLVVGANGSGKSLSYDSIVTLANGKEVQIGKLVEDQIKNSLDINNLDDGMYVDGDNLTEIISLNKDTMKSELKKVSKFIKRNGDDVYKIVTRNGKELKATKCHPIMCFRDYEVKSKTISELDIGMFIATPRIMEINSSKEDENFARLMGYIIGDGYIAQDRIEFVNNDKEVLEDYEKLILEFSKWGIRKRLDKNIPRIYCRDKEVYNKLRGLYPQVTSKTITSAEKDIPNYFLSLGKKSISNLLAGLFDTDGSVRKEIGTIEYCTKNKNLARQIQLLLLRFRIISKIKLRMCAATNTIEKKKQPYYYIYIYGSENLRKFYDHIPLRVNYKKQNLYNIVSKNQVSNENVDLLPQEINLKIRELTNLLGIHPKLLRKEYPAFIAYLDNRCAPSRHGVRKLLPLFHQKFALLHEKYNTIKSNQLVLIDFMDSLNISSRVASEEIGLNKTTIRNQWEKQKFTARPQNLINFKNYLSQVFLLRIQQISNIITLLENISNSDIYWDKIVSIEKVDKPAYVYDLTVEGNHNFIANNIFAHNSNISDALCFALGRLSAKSIRAEKTTSLLFSGSKYVKPAREAFVEITFDNSNKTFNVPNDEVVISRIIRSNGQGIYKINNEIKNRGDIIEMLAHAGIDAHGFNLVLQGQIQSIVRMPPEERRKVIEEVSGIAVYESRKEKALHELEKTEERIKEINAVLRERKSFLNNLEKERTQALKYKDLEDTINRCRYSIMAKKIAEIKKEIDSAKKSLEEKRAQREKIKTKLNDTQLEIDSMNENISNMNSLIKRSSGIERETLQEKINVLRGEIEGLKVRIESTQKRKAEFERRIDHLKVAVPEYKREIEELSKESPLLAKKQEEIKKKKAELVKLEEEKNRLLSVKTELYSIKERIKEKESRSHKLEVESDSLLKQIENISKDFLYKDENQCLDNISLFEKESEKTRKEVEDLSKKEIEHNRNFASSEAQIRSSEKIREQILKIDICPLCQNKMTQEHINHVTKDSLDKISEGKDSIEKEAELIKQVRQKQQDLAKKLYEISQQVSKSKQEYTHHKLVFEKHKYMKSIMDETQSVKKELLTLNSKKELLENKTVDVSEITEKYNSKLREIEEVSSRTTENLDQTLKFKEHELENILENIKNSTKDLEELGIEIGSMKVRLEEKTSFLSSKEEEEEEMNKKFKKLFEDRDKIQLKIQESSYDMSQRRTEISQITDQINYIEIGIAKLSASEESVQIEIKDVVETEPIKASLEVLQQKLEKTKQEIQSIGAINMRALEVYDQIKVEYDRVNEKVETLQKEKEEILKIVAEIDQKKKKTFMKTFKGVNELFMRNASELYSKGKAFLKIENEENMFDGGIEIMIQLGKGKYFDSTSLSGGEQTIIALSLLFAIQEFKPYHFYVFDEIDAALDKRNSERLAGLLNKYIKAGQYIIVTHNDALIMNSKFIYGVSMHDGISKILSLKLDKEIPVQTQNSEVPEEKSQTKDF